MKKLILHVGLHKTATTHLQAELNHEMEFLNYSGISYLSLNDFRGRVTSKLGWVSSEELRKEISDVVKYDRVILSDENIIGGPQEVEAGHFAKENMSKPLIAYIAGLTAPEGRRMGHAGAIISSAGESAAEKVAILQDLGVTICPTPSLMGETIAKVLSKM